MKITIEIKSCLSCRHLDHSGAFTVRGARWICGHSDACHKRITIGEFLKEYPEYKDRDLTHWKYHWIHRVVSKNSEDEPKEIPDWCPLKKGANY